MAKIKEIHAREILDSRGNPTIETTVVLDDKTHGTAATPSGASVGTYEAVELRDRQPERYGGLGTLQAIENIHSLISPKLIGIDVTKQQNIDRVMIELDGTQNKGKLGANAILSVSMAACKAAAKSAVLPLFLYIRQFVKIEGLPLRLPTPAFNLINGGKHAADNVNFQEFLLIPASSTPYSQALQIGVKVYKTLQKILLEQGLTTLVGDEGGYGPKLQSNEEALQLLVRAVSAAELRLGFDVFLGIDAAANSFYDRGIYHVKDRNKDLNTKDLIEFYKELNSKYHMLYLEDPISEDDWEGWAEITQELGSASLIVGDDLTVTNPYRLQTAIDKKAITGIIIKPNQIGTVSEALAVVDVARQAGFKITVSHRSGETNDSFIADFAVAVSADYAKFGGPARGERVSKYNRLLQIEKQIADFQSVTQTLDK